MTSYSPEFFANHHAGSLQSASEIVPFVCNLIQPRSVVDLGCGTCTWLSAVRLLGIEDTIGVDGDYVNRSHLLIPPDLFRPYDLTTPLDLGRKFDLAMSLEVAEHIEKRAAETFVTSLTRHAPVILFSAAIPYQGGNTHVNEQWPDYWINLFSQQGYEVIDFLRSHFWDNLKVEYWYAQNMFIFIQKGRIDDYPLVQQTAAKESSLPLRIVHPRLYEPLGYYMQPENVGFKTALRWAINALQRRLRGVRSRPYTPLHGETSQSLY